MAALTAKTKKMKKQIVTAIAIAITGTFPALAQDTAAISQLKEQTNSESIKASLETDGAVIEADGNGGYHIFARGTAPYYFNDPGAILDASKEATATAKTNLIRFIKEKLKSDEVIGKLTEQKVKNNREAGSESSTSVAREDVTRTMVNMSNSAEEIMTGILTLDAHKIPTGKEEGTYSVTVVVSPKTQKSAASIAKGNDASLKNRTADPTSGSRGGQSGSGNGLQGKAPNVEQIWKNQTDY